MIHKYHDKNQAVRIKITNSNQTNQRFGLIRKIRNVVFDINVPFEKWKIWI